jgi:hypothetical protein
MKQK